MPASAGPVEAQRREDAVVPIGAGGSELLEVHRQDARALLAGALGDELLDPGAQRRQRRLEDQRELVAAAQRQFADRSAELQSRILLRGHVGAAGHGHGAHPVEQPLEVDAHEGGRDHTEEAERRVPAADVAGIHEDGAEALVERLLLERGALVGDGHEVMTRVLPGELLQALVEIGVEARRLGGAAGLAGDHEQRALEIDGRLDGGHGGRVGGIEHVQIEVA